MYSDYGETNMMTTMIMMHVCGSRDMSCSVDMVASILAGLFVCFTESAKCREGRVVSGWCEAILHCV